MPTLRAALSLSGLLLLPVAARAQEWFASDELDYWGAGGVSEARKTSRVTARPSAPARPLDDREFRWEEYEDPTTDVFWDDGGTYVPPRPLRVAAADPSPENVANYLRWQRRKAQVISEFQRAVDQQTGRKMSPVSVETVSTPREQRELLAQAQEPTRWREVSLLFFYAAECPHCQASVSLVRELEGLGATVIPVQTDWQRSAPLLANSVPYTPEIAKEQPVDAVPLWVAVYDGDRITMQGEVTRQSIEVTLQMAQQSKQQRGSGPTEVANP